jgi:hypothetical protein
MISVIEAARLRGRRGMNRIFKLTVFGLIATIAWLPLRSWTQDAGQAAAFKTEEIEQLVAPIALYRPSSTGSDRGNVLIQCYKSAK